MHQRLAAIFALAAFGLLLLVSFYWRGAPGGGNGERVSFQIAAGPGDSAMFTVGQTIAGLISHPPGVGRCEISTVCGPSGVILSARTSQGSLDSLAAVNNGLIDSALVQSDIVEAAVKGQGAFRRLGAQRHIRILGALFPEQVHLLVAAASSIHGVGDLARKRVYLGSAQSGAAVTTRQILAAFGVLNATRRVDSADPAADLAAGKLDAYFLVAGAPQPDVAQLLKAGKARLVPIDGPAAQRLLRGDPQLQSVAIAAGTYPATPATATLAIRAVWIVRDRAPDALVYGLARALFNPANHAALAAGDASAGRISLANAVVNLPAPLHSGAARYYREAGKL